MHVCVLLMHLFLYCVRYLFHCFFCSSLLQRGADFNVEDDEGARADELARQCSSYDCRDAIVRRRQQHIAQLCTLVKQVLHRTVTLRLASYTNPFLRRLRGFADLFSRAVKRLISLIVVLMHISFVTFFSLFVLHLQLDVIGPLLLNASLLLVLTTDYSLWLMQVTELTHNWQILLSFDDCVIEWLCLTPRNVRFRNVAMFVFTVGAAGLRNLFPAVQFLLALTFFNHH